MKRIMRGEFDSRRHNLFLDRYFLGTFKQVLPTGEKRQRQMMERVMRGEFDSRRDNLFLEKREKERGRERGGEGGAVLWLLSNLY